MTKEPTVWRHKKRGTLYTEIGHGKLQSATNPAMEDTGVVFYRGQDGKLWARPTGEFYDGRFEIVKDPVKDLQELVKIILEFKTALPGWWFSIGDCSLTRHASCGPDSDGPDAELRKLPETRIFDNGFHCVDPYGTLASSLKNVMQQGLAAKQKWLDEYGA